DARRLPDLDAPLSALVDEPGGVRTLVRALRGGTRETAEESGAAGEETRASGEGTRASSEGTGAADVGGAPAAAADAGRSLRGHSPSDRPPPGPAA
ncbi:MAG TPA: hypothetical protein VNJ28_05850, partial [Candidatus Limnocylindrales bacterium]|nr:hypothetical protein [Candidatus Limnocylindrales bacterium]